MEPETAIDVAEPAPPSRTDGLVDAWFADWFFNQGLGVDLYNRFFAAKEDLKARLSGRKE